MALQTGTISLNKVTLELTGSGFSSQSTGTCGFFIEISSDDGATWPDVLNIETKASSFSRSMVGDLANGQRVRVRQYRHYDFGYPFGDPAGTEFSGYSNIEIIDIKLGIPFIEYILETDTLNIQVEISEPCHASINPLAGYEVYKANGSSWELILPRINTTSLNYDLPLTITENTTLTVVAINTNGNVTSPSNIVDITYSDIPQASTFEILGSDLIKIISESFNSIDNFINNRALMRFISSTINSSDLYNNIRGRFKNISSSISLSENIIKLQAIIEQIIYKIINDNVRLIEVKNRTMSKIRIISNQIGLTDGYKKLRGLFKFVSDSIGISDIWNYIVAKFIPNRKKSLDYKVTMQPLRYKAEVDGNMGEFKNGVYYFSVGESQEIPIIVASTDGSEFTIEDATFELVYNGIVLANGDAVLDDKTVFKLINFITPGTNQELKYKYKCVPVDVNKSAETLITRIPISVRN